MVFLFSSLFSSLNEFLIHEHKCRDVHMQFFCTIFLVFLAACMQLSSCISFKVPERQHSFHFVWSDSNAWWRVLTEGSSLYRSIKYKKSMLVMPGFPPKSNTMLQQSSRLHVHSAFKKWKMWHLVQVNLSNITEKCSLRKLRCAYQRGRDVCWDSSVWIQWAIIAANVVFCPARESGASECAIERYPMWQPKYHWQKEHASLESIIISQCNMWWFLYYVSLLCAPRLNKGTTASRVSILYDAESLNLITFECCNTET